MLENLDKLNWKDYGIAHGDGTHIPDTIKDLASGISEKQQKAYWKLDNYIVLQSDLYEAAFYVVPFLFEILQSDMTTGRDLVYDLLWEIANGYADDIDIDVNGVTTPLREACRVVVVDNLNIILAEVANYSSSFREKALELLASLYEYRKEIEPKLIELCDEEPSSEFQAVIKKWIVELNEE